MICSHDGAAGRANRAFRELKPFSLYDRFDEPRNVGAFFQLIDIDHFIYAPGPPRKPDSALSRLVGLRVPDDVGGCPRNADVRRNPSRCVSA
jgi:hypothetical protein